MRSMARLAASVSRSGPAGPSPTTTTVATGPFYPLGGGVRDGAVVGVGLGGACGASISGVVLSLLNVPNLGFSFTFAFLRASVSHCVSCLPLPWPMAFPTWSLTWSYGATWRDVTLMMW